MKTTIVAEVGSNWEGNIGKAKQIIKECKRAGADAVKFQMWRAHDLYSKKHPNWKSIKKSELTFDKAKKLKKYSDNIGIDFFCSVFFPEGVSFLESLNVKKYKVLMDNEPGASLTVKVMSGKYKGVVCSYGRVSFDENENDDGTKNMKFDYTLVANPKDRIVENKMLKVLGDILVDVMESYVSNGEIENHVNEPVVVYTDQPSSG